LNKLIKQDEPVQYFLPRFPFIIDSVATNSAAAEAGLQKGDHIIGIQDSLVPYFQILRHYYKNIKIKKLLFGF